MQRPLVIAHRGYIGRYIENTMPAFQAAADLGADWIECDVHLPRDGEVVIHHDETLKRLSERPGKLTDYTLGELQQVKLKQADQTGQIPSLADYLGWVKDKHTVTNIEIKRHTFKAGGIEKKVVYLVEENGLVDKSVISSFNHKTLHQVRKYNPDLKLAYLTRKWD